MATLGCSSRIDLGADDSTGAASSGDTTTGGTLPTEGPPATDGGVTTNPSGASTGPGPLSGDSTTDDQPPGSDFITDPDGGRVSFECSMFEQDCPRGQKCNAWANDGSNSWNATRCFPIDVDPDAPGEPCTVEESGMSGLDSCERGSMCWDVDPRTLAGYCVPFCAGSEAAPVCEDPEHRCTLGNNPPFLCLPTCDPLTQDCAYGNGCYVLEDTTQCAPDASGRNAGTLFETCAFVNACVPGLSCTDAARVGLCDEGAEGCCTPFCDLQAPTCPEGTQCAPAFETGSVPPGHEDVGVCGQDSG